MVAVEALAERGFDHGLAADVELPGDDVELVEHEICEIDIDSLNRRHHAAGIGEERTP